MKRKPITARTRVALMKRAIRYDLRGVHPDHTVTILGMVLLRDKSAVDIDYTGPVRNVGRIRTRAAI
ncbi:MAG: hypothetical protein M5R41_19400 [Bacteroidia bacterium]|nr:hypothetical protein [Bacteroidia bacterium]